MIYSYTNKHILVVNILQANVFLSEGMYGWTVKNAHIYQDLKCYTLLSEQFELFSAKVFQIYTVPSFSKLAG